MPYILNPTFDDWNHGTTFTNPGTGVQLADNWYSTGFTGGVDQGTSAIGEPFALLMSYSDLGEGFYQDFAVSNASSITITYCVGSGVSGPTPMIEFTLFDGVTTYSSGNLGITYSGGIGAFAEVTIPYNPAATTCRLTMLRQIQPIGGVSVDSIEAQVNMELELADTIVMSDTVINIFNHLFRLTLTDAMALVEEFDPPKFNIKGFTEVVRIQDWLRKRRRIAQNRWTN